MAISRCRRIFAGDGPDYYREVELDTGDYIVFPSCLVHKCIAAPSNDRVIVNTLLYR